MRTFNQQFLRLVPSGRKLVIGIPFIWLFLFFMLPFFFASAIAMELVKIYIRHKRTMMVRERGDIVKTEPSQREV